MDQDEWCPPGFPFLPWSVSSLLGDRSTGSVLGEDVSCGNSAKGREILPEFLAREQLDGPQQRQPFSSRWNPVYSTPEQLLEQQGWGGISVHKRRAWLMLNWHSFIGLHLGYLSYFSPGKTMLVAALTSIQPYFRHLHHLLSGKLSQICKVDIVVMALTKDILISLLKKVSESFIFFFFWSGFFVFSMRKMSRVFDLHFRGCNATTGRTRQWLEECRSQQ